MTLVLDPVPRKPTTGERLSQGIGRGLEIGSQLYQQNRAAQEQQLKQQQMAEALQQLGLDPRIMNLPPEAKEAFFKQAFTPEKQMTPLQKAQQALAEQRLKEAQAAESLYNQFMGRQGSEQIPTEQQGFPGQEVNQFSDTQQMPPDQKTSPTIRDVSDVKLDELSAFKGQPGQKGILGNMAQAEKERRIQEKKDLKESPEYKRSEILSTEQAKDDVEYFKDLTKKKSKQILKKESLNRLKNINQKKVSGKAYESMLEKAGLTALTSEGRRELAAEVKNQLTDFKEIAGSQLSASEFFVLSGAYPNADFSPKANEAIIKNLEDIHDTLDEEYKIAEKLKKENKNKPPEFFREKVNEKLQDYVSKKINNMKDRLMLIMNEQYGIPEGFTLMFDPDGKPLSVPLDKIEDLLNKGASLP